LWRLCFRTPEALLEISGVILIDWTAAVFVEVMFPCSRSPAAKRKQKRGGCNTREIRPPNPNISFGRKYVHMRCFGNITGINTAAVHTYIPKHTYNRNKRCCLSILMEVIFPRSHFTAYFLIAFSAKLLSTSLSYGASFSSSPAIFMTSCSLARASSFIIGSLHQVSCSL